MKFLVYILGYIVWLFSFLVPRNKRIWVFGGTHGAFSDNAKYLFIHTSLKCKEVKPVWITYKSETVKQVRSMGFKAYSILSPRGFYYAMRGGYYFFNSYSSDICFFTAGRAVCVNLWHGVGLKKIEFCIDRGPLYNRYVKKTLKERFFYPQVYRIPDYFISSTPFQSVKFAKAFRIDESKCLNIGYPRNDQFFMSKAEQSQMISKYSTKNETDLLLKMRNYNKIYLYMPTWRESQRNLFAEHMDLEVLNKLMLKTNSLFILKPHANTVVSNRDQIKEYSNLLLLGGNVDIYPLLSYTHVLVTDYSSILYDYLLLEGKGVILYLYDYKDYVQERDFNYPFSENVAGERAYTFTELTAAIERDSYNKSKYIMLRERFWGEYHGNACQDIADYFVNESRS